MTPAVWHDLRASVGFFTRIPVGSLHQPRPGRVMLFAPAVGAVVGMAAALVGSVLLISPTPGATWVAATAAVASASYLTGGLHLDGLADLADGLGARRDPAASLAVMHRSDIGPFGVMTLVLVLLLQITALGAITAVLGWRGMAVGLVVPLMAGRLSALWLCRRGAIAAQGSRSGAWVVGTVPASAAAAVGAAVLLAASLLASFAVPGPYWAGAAAVAAALLVGWALEATAGRRLGGITGDVLGATIEIGQCAALLVLLLQIT